MPFKKGQSGNPAGRKKGTLDVVPKAVKIQAKDRVDLVDAELTAAGNGLAVQAAANPQWFYEKIWVKILPKNVEMSGPDGGPIPHKVEVAFIGATIKKDQG
jgi:hypothetical protein